MTDKKKIDKALTILEKELDGEEIGAIIQRTDCGTGENLIDKMNFEESDSVFKIAHTLLTEYKQNKEELDAHFKMTRAEISENLDGEDEK